MWVSAMTPIVSGTSNARRFSRTLMMAPSYSSTTENMRPEAMLVNK